MDWLTETLDLIGAVERIKTPAKYLVDLFFSNKQPVSTSSVMGIETRKAGRRLAPYVVRGSKGVNMAREQGRLSLYRAPVIAAKRVLTLDDIEKRQFGEQLLYSTLTPAERAAQMQGQDLRELLGMIENRKNKMAADILTTGKTTIDGYADNGEKVDEEINFYGTEKTPSVIWSNANAKIFEDLKSYSEEIQESAGEIPTVLIIGKNVEKYLLGNKDLRDWLLIPSRENLNMASFAPSYISPQVRFIGYLSALNLEVYSYLETYTNESGNATPFIGADMAVIGIPKRGKQLFAAVTLLENGAWSTYGAETVPQYLNDSANQISSLTVWSRCLLAPESVDDFISIKTTG